MGPASGADQRFRQSVGISLGLHLGLAALALAFAGTRAPLPPPVLSVRLLAALPSAGAPAGGGGPTAPALAPTAPPRAPAPPVAKSAPPPVPVAARALPPRERAPSPRKPRPPAPAPQAPTAPVAQPAPVSAPGPALATDAPPDVSSGAPARGGHGSGNGAHGPDAGTTRVGPAGGGSPIDAYLALVRQRIQAEKRYSPLARRRGLEGVVTVRLELGPSGSVARVAVEDGAPLLLARATEEAVERAGPFPPPPDGLGVIRIPVRYQLVD